MPKPKPLDTPDQPVSNPAVDQTLPDQTPDKPTRSLNGVAVMNAGKPLAAFEGNADEILAVFETGLPIAKVAEKYGVSHQAMYAFLLRNAPEKWAAASAAQSLVKVEQAAEDLDSASDSVAVARSREVARLAQWNLERMAPRMYGDVKNTANGVNIQVVINRDGSADASVIDVDRDK